MVRSLPCTNAAPDAGAGERSSIRSALIRLIGKSSELHRREQRDDGLGFANDGIIGPDESRTGGILTNDRKLRWPSSAMGGGWRSMLQHGSANYELSVSFVLNLFTPTGRTRSRGGEPSFTAAARMVREQGRFMTRRIRRSRRNILAGRRIARSCSTGGDVVGAAREGRSDRASTSPVRREAPLHQASPWCRSLR
jgi:hypothetical protein